MTIQFLTPAGFSTEVPYRHVAVASGSRQVFVAGQVGGNDPGSPGESLRTQTCAALLNVARALESAGATFEDVARLTFYVVDWHQELMPELLAGVQQARTTVAIPAPMPPASLIGVQALFEPGVLVEVEATAVLA